MLNELPKVGIIYLSYYLEPHWQLAKKGLENLAYPREKIEFIIVDNWHEQQGSSAEFIKSKILPLSAGMLPKTTLLEQNSNLGFAAGCNKGIKKALELGCEYVYLHNQDGYMDKKCLLSLVAAMETDKQIGAAQSLIMLHPETDLINSSGNIYHFLGFGYGGNYRARISEISLRSIYNTAYVSGASALLRSTILEKEGLLNEDFFMYHEDLEYSLRLQSRGYRTVVVKESVFYHNYNFSRNKNKYYLMERNRLATLIMYYKLPTLILLLPIFVLIESGLFGVALLQGWLGQKFIANFYFINFTNLKKIFNKRKQIQATRTESDRKLLESAVGSIKFTEEKIANPVLKYIANPVMRLYWLVVRQVIFW